MRRNFLGRLLFVLALGLAFALSLWLRMGFPINALGPAMHDDLLFVRQAASIGLGHWLDAYDRMTHAKGIGYPAFLLVNREIGLPLKLTEHACYLGSALFFSLTTGRLYHSRWAALATFSLLAFIPVVWNPGVGGRVVRENFYVTLSLLLLTLGIRCWLVQSPEPSTNTPSIQLRRKWPSLLLLGLVAGVFWVTREEGVWLLPAMSLLVFYWLWRHRSVLRFWRPALMFLLLPVLAASLVVGAVNTANYVHYGVFRNNDFRSGDFQAGYGALTRIRHDASQRYVLFPRDARDRAYAMSAAARELKPFFEGPGADGWRNIGCNQTGTRPCPEILSGWFMWALRDAVADAGHYRTATEARRFYRQLADEIDEGCRQRPGECLPRRQTLVPPWQDRFVTDTLSAAGEVFNTLATLGGPQVGIGQSEGSPSQLAVFEALTHGPLAPSPESTRGGATGELSTDATADAIRQGMARWFADMESRVLTAGLPIALLLWVGWWVAALIRRHVDAPLMLATALTAAVVTRVGLLSFLEATSIPSNNMLYLFPVAPMALALLPVVLWGCLRFVRPSPAQERPFAPT